MKNKEFPLYKEGSVLGENEFMLKIREYGDGKTPPTGFMTKFNKNGSFPEDFKNWGRYYSRNQEPIYLIEEFPRVGWKVVGWRIGKSRSWAEMLHPLGFIVEIHLDNLLPLILNNTLVNGELQGAFRWEYSKLVKG